MSAPIGNTNGFKKGMIPWNKGLKGFLKGHPRYGGRKIGTKQSQETKEKISLSNTGRPSPNKGKILSEETKRKISEHRKGIPSIRKGISLTANLNEKNPQWKGDNVGYRSLHSWVRRKLGNIKECAICGNEGRIEWASISHQAKRDLNDYFPLCTFCHRRYDRQGGFEFCQV